MSKVLDFFATHPVGVAVKVGLAAMVAWVLASVDTFGLHPIVVVGLIPVLVAVIDWLNPQDARFGKGAS